MIGSPHTTVQEHFQFYIKDLRFHYGGVSFRHFIPALQKRLEFTIINYHIREEFDVVKNYFINVLCTKKIEVYASIQVGPNETILIEAYSPEVEKIDENTRLRAAYFFSCHRNRLLHFYRDVLCFTVAD